MYVFHYTHGFPHRSPGAWLLNPTSSPLVGNKQPVRELVSPQSFSESDQEEPVGINPWYRQIGKYFYLSNTKFDDIIWKVFFWAFRKSESFDIGSTEFKL